MYTLATEHQPYCLVIRLICHKWIHILQFTVHVCAYVLSKLSNNATNALWQGTYKLFRYGSLSFMAHALLNDSEVLDT